MNAKFSPHATAIARILMAQIFILSGLSKIGAADAISGYMQAMHVPAALLWPTIAFEIVAGSLIVLGYRTRIVSLLLAGFCVATALIFHHQFADPMQINMFLKNIAMTGGFVLLAGVGAGSLSLDARRGG
jgi:putative oxidoreductase